MLLRNILHITNYLPCASFLTLVVACWLVQLVKTETLFCTSFIKLKVFFRCIPYLPIMLWI